MLVGCGVCLHACVFEVRVRKLLTKLPACKVWRVLACLRVLTLRDCVCVCVCMYVQYFLATEGQQADTVAYDRPSSKLLAFLSRHYGEPA